MNEPRKDDSKMQYISARTRLSALPPVFTAQDLGQRTNWPATQVATYLQQWQKKGLVESFAPRSGFYFNLIKEPSISDSIFEQTIAAAMPTAVHIGAAMLTPEGWTTQHSNLYELATLHHAPAYHHPRLRIRGKGRRWYYAAHPGIDYRGELPCLTPAYALVDMMLDPAMWKLDPDDIDFDVMEDADLQDIQGAMQALGRVYLNKNEFDSLIAEFDVDDLPHWYERLTRA